MESHTTHNHSYRKVHSKSEISHLHRYFFRMMYHKTWPIHDSYDCIVLQHISFTFSFSLWFLMRIHLGDMRTCFFLNNKMMIFDICISMHGMVQWALNCCLCSFSNSESTMCTMYIKPTFYLHLIPFEQSERERKETNKIERTQLFTVFCHP